MKTQFKLIAVSPKMNLEEFYSRLKQTRARFGSHPKKTGPFNAHSGTGKQRFNMIKELCYGPDRKTVLEFNDGLKYALVTDSEYKEYVENSRHKEFFYKTYKQRFGDFYGGILTFHHIVAFDNVPNPEEVIKCLREQPRDFSKNHSLFSGATPSSQDKRLEPLPTSYDPQSSKKKLKSDTASNTRLDTRKTKPTFFDDTTLEGIIEKLMTSRKEWDGFNSDHLLEIIRQKDFPPIIIEKLSLGFTGTWSDKVKTIQYLMQNNIFKESTYRMVIKVLGELKSFKVDFVTTQMKAPNILKDGDSLCLQFSDGEKWTLLKHSEPEPSTNRMVLKPEDFLGAFSTKEYNEVLDILRYISNDQLQAMWKDAIDSSSDTVIKSPSNNIVKRARGRDVGTTDTATNGRITRSRRVSQPEQRGCSPDSSHSSEQSRVETEPLIDYGGRIGPDYQVDMLPDVIARPDVDDLPLSDKEINDQITGLLFDMITCLDFESRGTPNFPIFERAEAILKGDNETDKINCQTNIVELLHRLYDNSTFVPLILEKYPLLKPLCSHTITTDAESLNWSTQYKLMVTNTKVDPDGFYELINTANPTQDSDKFRANLDAYPWLKTQAPERKARNGRKAATSTASGSASSSSASPPEPAPSNFYDAKRLSTSTPPAIFEPVE